MLVLAGNGNRGEEKKVRRERGERRAWGSLGVYFLSFVNYVGYYICNVIISCGYPHHVINFLECIYMYTHEGR